MFSLNDYKIIAQCQNDQLLQINSHYPCRFCNIDGPCCYYDNSIYNGFSHVKSHMNN